MARESVVEVEGTIMEVLPNGMYRAELANGHRVLAYVAGKTRLGFAQRVLGDKVRLRMSPYDLSEGHIIVETQTI